MDKVGYRASLSDAERVILTWHVAILTGRRIASRLDRPGHGRSTALVRSMSLTCNVRLRMLIRIRLVSSKAFCYEAKTVEGVSWSIFILRLSRLHSPFSPLTRDNSNVFLDICHHAS
jgi:hypothetical protein